MRRDTPWLLWLATGLLVLLAGVAVLQYRWLGEVSEAGRQRMQSTLKARAEQFADEFDGEIARAFFWLQVEPDALDTNEWTRYAGRYDRWLASAARPRLVSEIWLLVPGRAPRRFNPGTRAFEETTLAPSLAAFWIGAQADLKDRVADPHAPIRWLHSIREDIPAIIVPIPRIVATKTAKDLRIEELNPLDRRGLTAIVLDEAYLRREMLPQLAARHFGAPGHAEYHVTISSRQSGKEVFSYGPALQQAGGSPDTTLSLFDVRLETLADLRAAARGGPGAPGPAVAPQAVIIRAPDGDPGKRREVDRRMAVSIVQSERQVKSTAAFALAGPRWELVMRHRAGSLEAAVGAARRRNLLLSMGVLEVLAVSIILLVVSVRRASRLAAQQVEFVAAVSHELRTPLAVIRSAGENLADGVVADAAQVRRYGELVRNEGLRLSSMVEQVLAFAGMRGGPALHRAPEQLRDVVDRAVASAAADLRDAAMEVDVDVPPDLPPVMIDGEAIVRAVANVLTNAAKYAADGRKVRITAAILAAPREIRIAVEDRGPGIAAADLPHVFEPFFRAPSVIASRIRGSGLGLSLVQAIARAHGGRTSVRSEPGRGSTFTMYLPLVAPRPAASATEPLPAGRS